MNNIFKNCMIRQVFILNVVFIFNCFGVGYCNEINKVFADPNLDLATRINFALKLASRKFDGKKIWLVYTISTSKIEFEQATASELSESNNISLYQILFEDKQNFVNKAKASALINDQKMQILPKTASRDFNNTSKKNDVNRAFDAAQLAIILDYSLESGRPCLYQVYVQNLSKSFDQEIRPMFWLGQASSDQSVEWLSFQFYQSSQEKFKQQAIRTIGSHDCKEKIVEFSKNVLHGKQSLPLKAEAISLAGKSNTANGLQLLISTAIRSNNTLLRKKALFALSQLSNDKAQLVIATIAKKEKNIEVRKEAIFWLAQVANSKSVKILNDIMQNETDHGIREYTLFAISQLPGSQSKPLLTTVALNDPMWRIRKKARLILKHSEDERFMNFFDELVRSSDSPN
ncbi:HEAT repeat domain-containing protein [candidate division KSB1 bacterium]|nr:HEAT repeat domain-containing protein [candidate division KSB1 bacterium]